MSDDPMIVSLRKAREPGPAAHGASYDPSHDPAMVVRLRHAREPQPEREITPEDRSKPPHPASPAIAPVIRAKKRRRIPGFVVLIGSALVLALGAGFYFSSAAGPLSAAAQANPAGQSASAALVAHIGKLILLPQGEDPTIATVTDLSALAGQAFFKNAALGDKVLMYPKAQEAVLYDPAQDKVIQVAPLSVSGQ